MTDPQRSNLPDGRVLSYDDVGDPDGHPVVYLHGTPDSRLARHPDDGLAARAGVRLLAVDRPGYGGTSTPSEVAIHAARLGPAPPQLREGMGSDLAFMLAELGVERATLLAWSGGALDGLVAAADPALADRIDTLHLVGALAPRDAFEDPVVRDTAEHRMALFDMADAMSTDELVAMAAPLLAPYPCDPALALEHQRDHRDKADQSALAEIPGALDRMAEALVEAVRGGLAGVERDVVLQTSPLPVDLSDVEVPVRLWYGSADTTTPVAFGEWFVRRLPQAVLHVIEGAGHYLPMTHWSQLLASLTR